MKKMLKKLRSRAGESIAEALIAVLVIALSMAILAGMIASTQDMIQTSKMKVNDYYTENARMETFPEKDDDVTMKITVGTVSITSKAEYIMNDQFSRYPVIAYRMGS